jgi:geranylgeranyl pyrophosphate synthase
MTVTGTTPFEEVLSAGGRPIRDLMGEVERQLADVTRRHGPPLARAAGGTLEAGGKRLRPLLVFICGSGERLRPARREALVRAASAVELVHMATLVHDDVLDGALLRRGRPTVYAAAGREAATATGDFLFSRAFSLLSANQDGEQVRALSVACLDLARGELAQRQDAYAGGVDLERYLYRCGLKTASLFTAACRLGGLASGLDDGVVAALGRFGQKVGLAFQVLDDVIDMTGAVERTGKWRGTDLLEGTTTLPLILAAKADPDLAGLDLRSIDSREQAELVCERIAATGALEEARTVAARLTAEAKEELGTGLAPPVRELLELVADRIVDRYA